MLSDRFSNCVLPSIPKPWAHYTDEEKARAINYKFTCGEDVVLFFLKLERQQEEIKAEVERRATPEYVGRVENWAFDRFDELTKLVKESERKQKAQELILVDLTEQVKELKSRPTAVVAESCQEHEEIMREVTGH